MRRSNFALRLQPSLMKEAKEIAEAARYRMQASETWWRRRELNLN